MASQIPNTKLRGAPLFKDHESVSEVDYDLVIYDTYDYLDKVISLSMSDPISAALEIYFDSTKDARAIHLQNYLRYGTNDDIEIWLIRYGFSFEDISWIKEHVYKISAEKIEFKDSLTQCSAEQKEMLSRYI